MNVPRYRRTFFLALLIVVVMALVSAFCGSTRELVVYAIGVASGALLWHLLIKYTLSVRTSEALQDVHGILAGSEKKTGKLEPPDPDYVLANGIMHGLRYLNLVDNPAYADSEFQVMCRDVETVANEPKDS